MESIETIETGRAGGGEFAATTVRPERWQWLAGAGFATLLVCLGAQVRIPLVHTDVPMTLQMPAVLVIGLMFAPAQAVSAVLLYLLLGVAGLPLFAGAGFWDGRTGGYLVGFLIAAWLISFTSRALPGHPVVRMTAAALLGACTVFACGLAGRTIWFDGSWSLAVSTGLVPFLVKAMVEISLAVAIARTADRFPGLRPFRGASEARPDGV